MAKVVSAIPVSEDMVTLFPTNVMFYENLSHISRSVNNTTQKWSFLLKISLANVFTK